MCQFVGKSIRIKYVDKTTGSPLFSQGSMYKPEDLKVTLASNSNYSPIVQTDRSDPAVIVLAPVLGGETLKLGHLLSDKITMQTRVRGKECCAGTDILSLKINDEIICEPCDDLLDTVAVIKK